MISSGLVMTFPERLVHVRSSKIMPGQVSDPDFRKVTLNIPGTVSCGLKDKIFPHDP